MSSPLTCPALPKSRFESAVKLLSVPMDHREFLVWCLAALGILMARLALMGGPGLSNDGYQYLSVARNFTQGRPAYTSLVHFDSERSHGVVPAPLTTFPPGYPAVIAALAATGMAPETSATVVSVAAVWSLLFLLRAAGNLLQLDGLGMRFLLLCVLGNAQTAAFATGIFSEPLFTWLITAGLLCYAAGLAPEAGARRQTFCFLGFGLLIGLSCWVRYAGLFLFGAAALFTGVFAVRRRTAAAMRALAGLAVAGVFVALGLLRNFLLVHTWKGGNDKRIHAAPVRILVNFLADLVRLATGHRTSWASLLPDLVLVLGLVVLAAMAGMALLGPGGRPSRPRAGFLGLGLWCLVFYCAVMFYLGCTSPISFSERMFVPVLPLAALVLVVATTHARERFGTRGRKVVAGLLLLSGGLGFLVNAWGGLFVPMAAPADQEIRATLALEAKPGCTAAAWIERTLKPGEVIVATRGQATGYVLGRPTVALISQTYTDQIWDEASLKELMRRFHARFLFVYRERPPEPYLSPYLAALAVDRPPAWLNLVLEVGDMRLFLVRP